MVTHSGATSRSGALRALNSPQAVQVKQGHDGQPSALLSGRRWQRVLSVLEIWRLDDEWWQRAALSRLYYRVELEQAGTLVLFQDLRTRNWFRQRA